MPATIQEITADRSAEESLCLEHGQLVQGGRTHKGKEGLDVPELVVAGTLLPLTDSNKT